MDTKVNEVSNNKFFKWTLMSLMVIIFVVIITLVVLYIIACNVGYLYAILIDAGSTSSKISVFKWRDWPFQHNGRVEEVYMQKVSPGISNYKDHPEEAFNKLKPSLLNLLQEYVPQDSKKSTRLFLAATAGMRLVELDNPLKADAIMESLRSQLPHVGAKVNNPYSDIRIMSGRDEGINAWITVNYLEKKFGVHGVAPSSGQEMIGALDLGGASAQITFVPTNSSLAPHTSTRYLFGSEYYVYSYSHLCYGKSAGQKRIWAEIIGNQSSASISNPCFLKNYELKVNKSEIFTEPCVKSKYAVELIGWELIPNTALPEEITLIGTGDPDQCRQFVEKMFPAKACAQSPCMFQGVYRPPLHGKFSAFSGYAFVIDHLNFPTKGQNLTRDAVKAKVDEFCRRDWTHVVQEYPASSLEFIAGYCQDGVYIDALLSNYGFVDSESWKSIVFASKIAGTTVSWAPGYLIDATGMIDSESPKIDLGLTAFVTSVVILSIVFVALLVILVFLHLRK